VSSELRDLYQEVIIDHSKKPRNFRKPDGANRSAEGVNPLCGDQITLYLKLADDVMQAGAMGVTFGRNVFQHRDPIRIVRALRRVVIDRSSVEEAMEVMTAVNA